MIREFADDLSRVVTLEKIPSRIVSLVPSLTEALCAMGLEEQLVGVTKFCVHPAHIRGAKVVIGGTKNVRFDKIEALRPDIIIANKEENTLEIVAQLERLCPVFVTDVKNIEDNLRMLQTFGELFNRRSEAAIWCARITSAQNELSRIAENLEPKKAAYVIWREPWMAAGSGTFIDSMMKLNRFINIFDQPRYPEFALESLALPDPEIILLSSEPFPFKDEHAFEIGRHTHHSRIIFVDGEMFSWFGTRPARAMHYFMQLHSRIK